MVAGGALRHAPARLWLALLPVAFIACSGGPANPPSGSPPPTGLPSARGQAAWLEIGLRGPDHLPDAPAHPVIYDASGSVHVLPQPLSASPDSQQVDHVALSPDGTKVAAVVLLGTAPNASVTVHVVDVATGATVATIPGGWGGIAWSPDSAKMVLSNLGRGSSPTQPAEIVTASGALVARLVTATSVTWAPSDHIALSLRRENILYFDGNGNQLPAPAPSPAPASPAPAARCAGATSPDGKTAIVVAETPTGFAAGTESFLQACDTATGARRRLTPNYVPVDLEQGGGWLPDGRYAVLVGDAFEIIDPSSGHARVLAHAPANSIYSSFGVAP